MLQQCKAYNYRYKIYEKFHNENNIYDHKFAYFYDRKLIELITVCQTLKTFITSSQVWTPVGQSSGTGPKSRFPRSPVFKVIKLFFFITDEGEK
jgi:hypothetical protein